MDRNTVLALLIIGVILFGFSWYNTNEYNKRKEEAEAAQREQFIKDSILFAQNKSDSLSIALTADSIKATDSNAVDDGLIDDSNKDPLVAALSGTEELHMLENSLFKLTFSNKGGRIARAEIKDYTRYGGDPLVLFDSLSSSFGMSFYCPELVNTAYMYMEPREITDKSITYRLAIDSTNYMEYRYTIRDDEYMMDMVVDFSNAKGRLALNQPDLLLNWHMISQQQEKGFRNENNHTTVAYKYPGETSTEDIGIATGPKSQNITTLVEWVGFKQQFFSSIIISEDNFTHSDIGYDTFAEGSGNVKDFKADLRLPYTPDKSQYNLKLYLGPNKYTTLREYEEHSLHRLVPLGWGIFGWVNRFLVIPVVDFLGGFINNFGVVILLLTLIVKIIILPLTYKSYLSTAKMRLLRPQLDKINKKYPKKEDALKKQQETMGLYKKAGVSPMGGCIPMLIQMPILIALFRFFPTSIELRQKSFLWADDLSSYDSVWDFPGDFSIPFYGDHISLFTLLMSLALFVNAKISASQTPDTGQIPGMKFMMIYFMPIMLLFAFNNFAAGLMWYYFLSTMFTIGQTYLFRYVIVNDDKLHAKMAQNAQKPVKKSKWAERMEQMQKQVEAQKRAQGKK